MVCRSSPQREFSSACAWEIASSFAASSLIPLPFKEVVVHTQNAEFGGSSIPPMNRRGDFDLLL